MHWYELTIYGLSAVSVVTAIAIGVLAYRFFSND